MEFLIVLLILRCVYLLPAVKGRIGELAVILKLKRLDRRKHLLLNDLLIPLPNGTTAQIDHVVVSAYGIFVIETKNYQGWIFGSEKDKKWTQITKKSKNQFYNPIIQNKGHIKALQHLLSEEYPSLPHISIVNFLNPAEFKKLDVQSHVIYSPQLLALIQSYTETVLSPQIVEQVAQRITAAHIDDQTARKQHVKNVEEIKQGKLPTGKAAAPHRESKTKMDALPQGVDIFMNRDEERGKMFQRRRELDVRSELNAFDPDQYLLLEGLRLRSRGTILKAPYLLLSAHGIFIIDTKNYGGRIRGNDTGKHWVSRIGRKLQRFPNPVLQERASENTVKHILRNFGNIPCFCITVFADNADFSELESSYAAFRLSHLYTYIESYQHTYFTISQLQDMALKVWDADSTPLGRRRNRWIRQAEAFQNEQQRSFRKTIRD